MPLENATMIHELIATNPDGNDIGGAADDHLRMIKAALLGSFPNLLGQVTASHTALNNLPADANTELAGLSTSSQANADAITALQNNPVAVEAGKKAVIDLLYPVGAIFFAVSNITPPSATGVTWTRIAQGRTLIGEGSATDARGEAKAFTGGAVGGEFNHVLTEAEMPTHNHNINTRYGTVNNGLDGTSYPDQVSGSDVESQYSRASTGAIANSGNDQPHNNMQPYLVTYIWKRTA